MIGDRSHGLGLLLGGILLLILVGTTVARVVAR